MNVAPPPEEQEMAEQSARENRHRYKRLLEATTDYIYTVNLRNGVSGETQYGSGCKTVTGFTPLEFETDPYLWYRIIHHEDRAVVMTQIERILHGEEPPSLEHRILHKDGRVRWIRNTCIPHRNGNGRLVAYDGLITDITPRKQAEELLRTLHGATCELNDSSSLLEGMTGVLCTLCTILLWDYAAYWAFDRKGDCLRCEATWFRHSSGVEDCSATDVRSTLAPGFGLPGHVWSRGEPTWIADTWAGDENLRASLPQGWNLRCACACPVRVNKEVFGVLEVGSQEICLPDEHMLEVLSAVGNLAGQFIVRKRSEESLRESQERLALVIEGSNDGVWDWNLVTNESYFSPRWKEMLGYKDHEVENTFAAWKDLIHPDDQQRAMDQLQAYLNGGVSTYALEHRLRDKSGAYRWILARGVALRDAEGKPVRMAGSHVDLTDRKLAAERLERVNAELARREAFLRTVVRRLKDAHNRLREAQDHLIQAARFESIGTLAAGVAHEVKNPLQTMLMGLYYLSRRLPGADEDLTVTLDDMREAVTRADSIVGDLLTMSSLKDFQMAPDDLNTVLSHTLHLIQNQMDASQIEVVARLAPTLPRVRIDRNKIHQLFINLFINAKQAMPSGGVLTVTTRMVNREEVGGRCRPVFRKFNRAQRLVMVEVQDTGAGIEETHLKRIFDPFFTTKPPNEGTGLGLFMSMKIVELHGGALDISNAPSGGVLANVVLKADAEEFS